MVGPTERMSCGDVVVVGQVLAHQRGQHEFGHFDEVDGLAGYVHGLPPADMRVKGSAEVVLLDLVFVQRPAVVLVLADVKPRFMPLVRQQPTFLESGVEAHVQPVAGELTRLPGGLAHPGHQLDHPVAVQQRFEGVDLVLRDGALGQHDDIDTARLLAGGDQHTIQQVQIEPFGRGELEESIRVLGRPQHRAHRVKVGCLHAQRPGQQQQVGVLGAKIGTAMAGRDLVPAGVDAGALHAGIAREGQSSRRRRDDLGQDPQEAGVDAGQRSGASQQLAAAGPIHAALAVGAVHGHAEPGTGLVGDGMQRQQRLTHSVLSSERQFLDRHIGALAKDPPLIGDQIGQRAGPVLRPGAPAPARLLDRLRPVGEPAGAASLAERA